MINSIVAALQNEKGRWSHLRVKHLWVSAKELGNFPKVPYFHMNFPKVPYFSHELSKSNLTLSGTFQKYLSSQQKMSSAYDFGTLLLPLAKEFPSWDTVITENRSDYPDLVNCFQCSTRYIYRTQYELKSRQIPVGMDRAMRCKTCLQHSHDKDVDITRPHAFCNWCKRTCYTV